MKRLLGVCSLALTLLYPRAHAQVIEYESNGLKYQTLTKSGVTIMFALLPSHLHEYTSIQVAVSNGSDGPYVIRPEDFAFVRDGNVAVRAVPALTVVAMLQKRAAAAMSSSWWPATKLGFTALRGMCSATQKLRSRSSRNL